MRCVLPLLLLACNPPIPETSQGDDSGSTATESTYNWVVYELKVAADDDGFDLDGDGTRDNRIAAIATILDAAVEAALADSSTGLVLQLSGVVDVRDDPVVAFAALKGDDLDGDHSTEDNYSGEETFGSGGSVDAQGVATTTFATGLSGGSYTVRVDATILPIGNVVVVPATPVDFFAEDVTQAAKIGMVGMGLAVDDLVEFGRDNGLTDPELSALEALADLDTDGDGETDDAISAAFRFRATSCGIN